MTKRKKKITIAVIITTPIVLAVLFIFSPRWDEPPPKDDDLMLTYGNIPDDENAYFFMTQLKGKVTGLELAEDLRVTKMKKGEEKWDDSLLEKYAKKNEEAFKILEKALECKSYRPPSPIIIPHSSIAHFTPVRELSRQLSYSAYKMISEGKDAEAFDIAFRILTLGQLMENGVGSSLDYMTGDAIKSIGFGVIRKCIETANLDTSILKTFVVELKKYRADEQGLGNAIKREYMYISYYAINEAAEGRFPLSLLNSGYRFYPNNLRRYRLLKPNMTRRMVVEKCRKVINGFSKTYNEIENIKKPSLVFSSTKDIPLSDRIPLGSNKAGRILFEYLTEYMDQILTVKARENTTADLTRVLLALKFYNLDHGNLPDILDALVPEYLDKVPIDDFDGKPMKYSKKDKIVYSVGPDMKDSGGKKEWSKSKSASGEEFLIHDDEGYKIEF
jgi:hypothetical protein